MENGYNHVYNRGAHKALIFHDGGDYRRFIYLLYLCNGTDRVDMSKLAPSEIYSAVRMEPLVNVIAYCLMPNHFHIALIEPRPGLMAAYVRKICTGYAMYYNLKYKHSGTIFQGKYKAKEISDERYLETLINYIHLNPYKIIAPDFAKDAYADEEHLKKAVAYSKNYEFSSFKDYLGEKRPQGDILRRSDLRENGGSTP
jgi:REP element-mobilizing transposase RayT